MVRKSSVHGRGEGERDTPLSRRDGSVSAEAKANGLTVQDPGPVPTSGVEKIGAGTRSDRKGLCDNGVGSGEKESKVRCA